MTTFDTPEAISRYRAVVCKGALKLFKVGLCPGRGWTKTRAMQMASEFTGKTYKRGQLEVALKDMTDYVANLRAGA